MLNEISVVFLGPSYIEEVKTGVTLSRDSVLLFCLKIFFLSQAFQTGKWYIQVISIYSLKCHFINQRNIMLIWNLGRRFLDALASLDFKL